MKQIAVVILNWNGVHFLQKFLSNVLEHSLNENVQVYIIDNASTDNSITFLQENYPRVPIIQLNKNYGFAEGYNKGLQLITADYYVLLNSDVEVTKNWIDPIITEMESNEKLAICMPKLKMYDNKELFEYAGAAGGFIDKFGYPFCRGRLFDIVETDSGQYNFNSEIFWASGAAMFVKSEVYKKLGGLDNDFFAHMEEIDFCWRAKNAGYSIQYIHNSIVYHVGGGTLPKSNSFKTYLNFRNNLFLLYKNLPNSKLHKTLFTRKILDGIAFLKFLISGEFQECKAIYKAHIDYYKSIKKLKVKRLEIQKLVTKHSHDEILQKSIVYEYFIHKKRKISM